MPTIIDPDNLRDAPLGADSAQNIYIDTSLRTIKVRNNDASGNANKGPVLDNTGVTLQTLYSFLKEEWKNDPLSKGLINYPFPLIAITPEQFEWRFGWAPADADSRTLLRTGGWREFDADNSTLLKEFVGVITLGNIEGDQTQAVGTGVHKAYYGVFDADSAQPPLSQSPVDFNYSGPVNEAVQTYQQGAGGFDYRSELLQVFVRSYDSTGTGATDFTAYTYDQTSTADIGIAAGATIPYNVQRFPLAEGVDIDVSVADYTIAFVDGEGNGDKYAGDGTGPKIVYNTISRPSSAFGYANDLTGGPYYFGIEVDATNGAGGDSLTKSELYSWVQRQLRQSTNIEDSASAIDGPTVAAKIGKFQDQLLGFVGPDLQTQHARNPDQSLNSGKGVAILNFNNDDINDISMRSDSSATTLRIFPFTSSGNISFSADTIAVDSSNAKFFMFYEYTKKTPVTDLVISNVGASGISGFTDRDSATFSSAGGQFSNSNTANGTTGVTLSTAGAAPTFLNSFFKLEGLSSNLNTANEQIWRVTNVATGGDPTANVFSAVTWDDAVTPVNEAGVTGTVEIREHPINSPDALLVDSAAGGDITGTLGLLGGLGVTGGSRTTVNFTYDYEANTQGDKPSASSAGAGQRAAAAANIVIRAIGLDNGSFAETSGTITEATGLSFSVVSAVERNYSNP